MGTHGMIEAIAPVAAVRRAYDLHSLYYRWLVAPLEQGPRNRALEMSAIQPHEKILEVAVGPGLTFVDILKKVHRDNLVEGVDLSPKMLERTRRLADSRGLHHYRLQEADARKLPFADGAFDLLVNNYMLDLIPLNDLPAILAEFRRVLKPGGRLVLVNMSKESEQAITLWERLYALTPSGIVPFLFGGCRPVLASRLLTEAGFVQVNREFLGKGFPSEIVTGRVQG